MHIELRRIQHNVRDIPHGIQPLSFRPNPLNHRLTAAHRVRPARLREAAHQCLFAGLQEDHPRRKHLAHLLQNRRKAIQPHALANIHHQGRELDLDRLADQVGKPRNQFQRQIVDRVVAQVLKRLQSRQLPRARHAGQDHQLAVLGRMLCCLRRTLRSHGAILALHRKPPTAISRLRRCRSCSGCVQGHVLFHRPRAPYTFHCLLLLANRLLLNRRQCIAKRHHHVGGLAGGDHALAPLVHGDIGDFAIFVDGQYDLRAGRAAYNLFNCPQPCRGFIFVFLRDDCLSSRVLDDHSFTSRLSSSLIYTPQVGYQRTRLWWVLGICMSSRYLATVRRVTRIPCRCNSAARWSSVSGLRGSSSSISFFTLRFSSTSGRSPPSGPFTPSLKKKRSSYTPCDVCTYLLATARLTVEGWTPISSATSLIIIGRNPCSPRSRNSCCRRTITSHVRTIVFFRCSILRSS